MNWAKAVTFLASDRLVARSSAHQTINHLGGFGTIDRHLEHNLGVGFKRARGTVEVGDRLGAFVIDESNFRRREK
jgi:hypothetical protein